MLTSSSTRYQPVLPNCLEERCTGSISSRLLIQTMINANLDLMLCPASSLHPCRITVGIGMVCKSKTVAGILEFYWNIDNAKVLKTTPEIVEQETYDNSRSSNPLKDKFSFKKEISHVTTFSHEHGFEVDVGASYTFKAGITEIAETEESVHVDVSTSHTWKFGQDNVTTQTYEHERDGGGGGRKTGG